MDKQNLKNDRDATKNVATRQTKPNVVVSRDIVFGKKKFACRSVGLPVEQRQKAGTHLGD